MGSSKSKGSAPTVIMPSPTAPQTYVSVVPQQDYRNLSELGQRLTNQANELEGQRWAYGTPAELAARGAKRDKLAAAAYLSGLPTSDKYTQQTTGRQGDAYAPVKEAAKTNLTDAEKRYAEALAKAGDVPTQTQWGTPGWSTTKSPYEA